MEITKQNETYTIQDNIPEGWSLLGSASKSINGDVAINFNISKPGELIEEIGTFNYDKSINNSRVNVTFNVSEADRDAFITYADTVIDTVLAHFNN